MNFLHGIDAETESTVRQSSERENTLYAVDPLRRSVAYPSRPLFFTHAARVFTHAARVFAVPVHAAEGASTRRYARQGPTASAYWRAIVRVIWVR